MERNRAGTALSNSKVHSDAFTKRDETIDSIMSKLITPKGKTASEDNVTAIPTQNDLQPMMRDTMQRANDADNAFDVLPDLEMVAQIAISSILSSKDLITTTVDYSCTNIDVPFELRNGMLKVVNDHFKDEYKLHSYLYDILYDVMFKTGSYPVAIIPESAVDTLIKSGREGVAKESIAQAMTQLLSSRGFLGSTADPEENSTVGLESLTRKEIALTPQNSVISFNKDGDVTDFGSLHITDNMDVLKIPKLKKVAVSNVLAATYNTNVTAAMESFKKSEAKIASESVEERNINAGGRGLPTSNGDFAKFDNSTYSQSPYSIRTIEELPQSSASGRPNVGHPLVQHIPSEAVIPVHVPGDFKVHVGYLVLLDKLGNPVNRHDLMNTTQAWSWIGGDASSQLLKDAAAGLGYGKNNTEQWTVAKLTDCYADLVDKKLKNSLENGIYGDSVTITRPQEVYRIMMARALAKKQTQILYIPVEQMTYFAFDYTDTGIGRSLTDKNKVITAGRAAIMFATLQSSILNATRNMQYTITLSPEDREPEKTIDDAQHRIMQAYGGRVPFTGSINDMEAYFTNAGISFNIEGNDYYPSTSITVADNTPDYKVPDRDVDEDLAKRNYRGFGVDPDLIMTPGAIEFATQVLSKDLIATKQTCKRQEKFAPLLTHFCRSYIISSGILMSDLAKEVISYYETGERKLKEGEMGHYLNLFINGFSAELPAPDMSILSSQMDSYKVESDAIDEIVKVWLDSEFLQAAGLNDVNVDSSQAMIANYLKRSWFRKNGVLPELIDMFDDKEQRQDFVKAIADDNVNISEFILQATKRVKGRLETVQKAMGIENGDGEDVGMDGTDAGGFDDADSDSMDDTDFGDGASDSFDDSVDSEPEEEELADEPEAEEPTEDDEEDLDLTK